MYSKEVRNLLTSRLEKHESVLLPKLLDEYLKGRRPLDEKLFQMIAFWLGNLEAKLYKTNKPNSPQSYDRKLDRVLLFVEYAKENAHKDGALLMTSYRFLFPYADLYLKLKQKRISIGTEEMTVTKRIQAPELKHIRVILTIKSELERQGKKESNANILASWVAYQTQKFNRPPGRIATSNFLQRLVWFKSVVGACIDIEQAWEPRSGSNFPTY